MEIRYTAKHHQEIEWNDEGIYRFNGKEGKWIRLNSEDEKDYLNNAKIFRGLFKVFTETNTTNK